MIAEFLVELVAGKLIEEVAGIPMKQREESVKRKIEELSLRAEVRASTRSFKDEIGAACVKLARQMYVGGIGPAEDSVWRLLSDESFHLSLYEWVASSGGDDEVAARERIISVIRNALLGGEVDSRIAEEILCRYVESIERSILQNSVLTAWRHQLYLSYLKTQVDSIRAMAEEAAGKYSKDRQNAVLEKYCERALKAWDIIDLSNLPEGDIHIVTQKLMLRQLYMPLRIMIEQLTSSQAFEDAIRRLEDHRDKRRKLEAGYFIDVDVSEIEDDHERVAIGERMSSSRRLVILGDPGGGKTTLLRWIATSYLLRHMKDESYSQIPDTSTLPAKGWIPVLIRCRDLGEADLCRSFDDFLLQHLRKSELLPDEADVMRAIIMDKCAKGEIVLLIDGLDEISSPKVRATFCQELESTSARYPEANIVVTSRIVGYRDMPYRMGYGFEHGVIAELAGQDKDVFAERWIELTEQHQTQEERSKRRRELIEAFHSSDRIERLTGNPMLLTTLALVKRKVGRLPNRRTKLYAEAVSVLLNWNPRLYEAIEEEEAVPQLEYLAYEMSKRGVQRLADQEVMDLLVKLREEYPQLHAVRERSPREFLRLLEQRSSLLIKSGGGGWGRASEHETPVWEFRHLTFQEYLAARAIIDGKYPGRDKRIPLADQVAPLVEDYAAQRISVRESGVPNTEAWREAIRLLISDCKDDDVDDLLLTVLGDASADSEVRWVRSSLAMQCLADEPNVSPVVAETVIDAFVRTLPDEGSDDSSRYVGNSSTVGAILNGRWGEVLSQKLAASYITAASNHRTRIGWIWAAACYRAESSVGVDREELSAKVMNDLGSNDRCEVIASALLAGHAAIEGAIVISDEMISILVENLGDDCVVNHAVCSSLNWIRMVGRYEDGRGISLDDERVRSIDNVLRKCPEDEVETRRNLIQLVASSRSNLATGIIERYIDDVSPEIRSLVVGLSDESLGDRVDEILEKCIKDSSPQVRSAAADCMGGRSAHLSRLIEAVNDEDENVRSSAVAALGEFHESNIPQIIIPFLGDASPNVRFAAADALSHFRRGDVEDALMSCIQDEDDEVRSASCEALGGAGSDRSISALIQSLNDEVVSVVRSAISALGKLRAVEAVGPIIQLLGHENSRIKMSAARALGSIGGDAARVALTRCLDVGGRSLKPELIRALGWVRSGDSVDPISKYLKSTDARVRAAAYSALAAIGGNDAIKSVSEAIPRLQGVDLAGAAIALKSLGEDKGKVILRSLLTDSDQEVRQLAFGGLLGGRDDALRKVLSVDVDGAQPWLDPAAEIDAERVKEASRVMRIKEEEVRGLIESVASEFNLKLDWKEQVAV